MKKYLGFGTELTLLELVIVIGLFAILTTLDLRIFAAAKSIGGESDNLAQAVAAVENAAECFKANCPPELYYDRSWQTTDAASAVYTVSVNEYHESGVRAAKISVMDSGGLLFSLTAKVPEVSP